MNWLQRALGAFSRKAADIVRRAVSLTDTAGWKTLSRSDSNAGKDVTADNALTLSFVWACVNLLAGTIASFPGELHVTDGRGRKTPARSHPLYGVLHDSPNADQTAYEFWEYVVACLELWGNFLAKKEFNDRGQLIALTPVHPEAFHRYRRGGIWRYRFALYGEAHDLSQDEVFHIRGFGGGLSTLSFARQSFGLALATDEAAAGVFKNGLRPSGQLVAKDWLKDDQYKAVEERVLRDYAGSWNAGKPMWLEGGMEWKALSLPPEDVQMIQSRQFSVEDGCRFFGIPPHMVGHTTNTTSWGTGLEQQTIGFKNFSLLRRLRRIEQAVKKQLLSPAERLTMSFEFNVEGLMRADSAGRAAYLSTMTQNGLMTRNEARRKENLEDMPGGDTLTVQSNLIPLDRLGEMTSTGSAEAAKNAVLAWLGHNGGPPLKD